MTEFLHSIDILLAFTAGAYLWPRLKNQINYPYQYQCPTCSIEIKTNQKAFFEEAKQKHIDLHDGDSTNTEG